MKSIFKFFLVLGVITSCNRPPTVEVTRPDAFVFYSVELKDDSYNEMEVTVSAPVLGSSNNIYQFASTAPGTYQIMDIGRFVSDFRAFDDRGREIGTTKLSTNQYRLSDPSAVRTLRYTVKETWDTPVQENKVYPMCGTSIEKDHLLFNAHCALGYFRGLQAMPIQLRIVPMDGWEAGSAMEKNAAGHYMADSYDHLVDSPVLMGRLSFASKEVNGTVIDLYTYSKTDRITSAEILGSMEYLLAASDKFLEGLPVDRYVFLFHFEDRNAGAWEHSYSSEYVYRENEWEAIESDFTATAAHEFFHIVTPLNIHSEVIEQFNFVSPTPSLHLWFYEGVTEWASDMILLQADAISLEEYFDRMQEKLLLDENYYDDSYSLIDLAKTSYTAEGHRQYANIYYVGAMIAGMMDIRIMELTGGAYSLRQLIVDLARDYGPDKPFREDGFFEEIVDRTDPGLEPFINKFIRDTAPLPVKEFYSKVGVNYRETVVDSSRAGLGFAYLAIDQGIYVLKHSGQEGISKLQPSNFITAINGMPVNNNNIREFVAGFADEPVGTPVEYSVYSSGEVRAVTAETVYFTDYHVFSEMEDPSPEQLAMRNIWLRD